MPQRPQQGDGRTVASAQAKIADLQARLDDGRLTDAQRESIRNSIQRMKGIVRTGAGANAETGGALWADYQLPAELMPFVGRPYDSLSTMERVQMNEFLNTLPVDQRAMAYNALRGLTSFSGAAGAVPSADWIKSLGLYEGEIYQIGGFARGNGYLPGGANPGTSSIDDYQYYGQVEIVNGDAVYTPFKPGAKAVTFAGAGQAGSRPGVDTGGGGGEFGDDTGGGDGGGGGQPPQPGAFDNGDGTWTLRNGTIVDRQGNPLENQSIFQYLKQFLSDNELPSSLINFMRDGLTADKPPEQIIAELRQTAEYKQAYPENDLRQGNGLSWMPEAWIRDYRNEAKRLAHEYMGVEASNTEVAQLIGRGVSLQQWEHRLQVNDAVQRWGGAVQQVFESATGGSLSQERLHAFFDPNQDTADIDEIYDMALRRGQAASLGFAVRPEEEAKMLRDFGLSAEQVFKNYQQIRSELPRFERLAAIGGYLDKNGGDFFGDVSVSGSLLFRAVNLGDPTAIAELQRRSQEEAARYQAGGGAAVGRGGVLTGLSLPGA